MQVCFCRVVLVFLLSTHIQSVFCQTRKDSTRDNHKRTRDSIYITRLDTMLHLQSWISANDMEYKIVYDKDFKLVLAPNRTNNLSFGFSYRYLDLGLSFSPQFLNAKQDNRNNSVSERVLVFTALS